jgi:DNA primase
VIKKESIERVRETARIEDVVGDYVSLKKRGANMLGLCPFHNEKTPSFTVSPAKGIYKCFGCSASGDSLKFIMELEHFSYPDAIKYLAKKYNIELEETEITPEYRHELDVKESLFAVNQFAEQHFIHNLWEDEKGQAIGLSYFIERGFTDATIKKFRLGYAQDEWTHFTTAAQQEGYKIEYLKAVGLTSSGEKNLDVYRGRVMFPIHNISGRVLGFGGRILKQDKNSPKYINSPESDIYNKSNVLYGLYFAKNTIVKQDNCFLVEGYTDVIALHQAGIENVVASSGTSLTEGQIQLIKRYTPNITILYDGDAAGIKASFRGINMILSSGMNVSVVLFPDGEDPDSYSRKVSLEELTTFLSNKAQNFIRFKTDILMKDAGSDPLKKAAVIRDMVESIALIPDGIKRSLFVQECSSIMKIEEQVLLNELNKIRRQQTKEKFKKEGYNPNDLDVIPIETVQAEQARTTEQKHEAQEREIIRILLNYAQDEMLHEEKNDDGEVITFKEKIGPYIIEDLTNDEMLPEIPLYASIFKEIEKIMTEPDINIQQYFIQHTDDSIRSMAIELMTDKHSLSKNWMEKYGIVTQNETEFLHHLVIEAIHQLKLRKLNDLIESERKKLNAIENEEELNQTITFILHLETIKKTLFEKLSTVIFPN